jgi:hypothetical protein
MATILKYSVVGVEYEDQQLAQQQADAANAAAHIAYLQALADVRARRTALNPKDLKVGAQTLTAQGVFPDPQKPDTISPVVVKYEEVWDVLDTTNNAVVVIGVDAETAESEAARLNQQATGQAAVVVGTGSPENPDSALGENDMLVASEREYEVARREQRVDA